VQIGVFRPSTGRWYLDNGNGTLDACTVDSCASFGGSGDLPVVGDWLGSGTNQLGVFDPKTRLWELDRNLNDVWEECVVDLCLGPFGKAKDLPVVGAWESGKKSTLLGVFRPGNGRWYLDSNGNGLLDGARIDRHWGPFGLPTHLPVTGDWTGTGVALPGTFDPATGQWQLDRNGNGIFDGCTTDICFGFGQAGDLPITDDWTGTGTAKAGVFSPDTGAWRLDLNGNGAFDEGAVDACLGPFGQSGDRPVVGNW
jgi:hypothetical protein